MELAIVYLVAGLTIILAGVLGWAVLNFAYWLVCVAIGFLMMGVAYLFLAVFDAASRLGKTL